MTDDHAMFQQQLRYVPVLEEKNWLLIIDGYVTRSLTLNYNTLTRRPSTAINAALMCSGHTPETLMIGEAAWEGGLLSGLLDDVQPASNAQYIAFHGADGYATSVPIAEANATYLIHTMNEKPLPPEHGFPVRVLIPGLAGYKQPKWVTHITLTDSPVKGFWERRGLPTDGVVNPIVTIQADKARYKVGEPVQLSGLAYAGRNAIRFVNVSINRSAPMSTRLSANHFGRVSHWQTTWTPSAPGYYNVEVSLGGENRSRCRTKTIIEVTR